MTMRDVARVEEDADADDGADDDAGRVPQSQDLGEVCPTGRRTGHAHLRVMGPSVAATDIAGARKTQSARGQLGAVPNRSAARARAFAASVSRSFGGAVVVKAWSSVRALGDLVDREVEGLPVRLATAS